MATPQQFASLNISTAESNRRSNGLVLPGRGQLRLKDKILMSAGCNTGDVNTTRGTAGNAVSSYLSSSHNNDDRVSITTNSHNSDPSGRSLSTSTDHQQHHPANMPSTSHGGGGGGGLEQSPNLLESPDEENKLRTTCDGCTLSKIKCDGGHPCKRCQRRKSECVYSEKKRCGPKRRRSSREESEDEGDAAMGFWGGGGAGGAHDGEGGPHGGVHKVLTSRERQFLSKFYGSVNKFIPLTNLTVLRDAMNPLPLNVIAGVTATEAEKNVHHARKAVLLGGVGVGAVFCGDASSAGAYMAQAQIHLKDCFDALLPEVVSCYLIMVVYHLHFLDHSKIFRYIGFAQQAYRELVSSKQPVAAHLRDSVGMLSTFLHVACNSDIRVEEVDLRAETIPEPGTNQLSRILVIFSQVLLMLYRRFDPESAAKATPQKPLPSMESLAAMADEADVRLSMIEDPGSFAVIVLKTLRGYFLLLKGKEKEVLEKVAIPVAKALAADTGVLCFPLCWHMCQCMRAFLRRKGLHTVATSMDQVMDPLKQHLAYTSTRCGVAINVMSAYAGKSATTAPPPVDEAIFPTSNADGNGGGGSRRGAEGGRAQSPAIEDHHRDANSRASQVSPPPASAAAVAAAAAAAEAAAAAKSQAVSAAAASRHYQQIRHLQESSGAGVGAGRRHAVSSADFEGREGCERGVSAGGGGGGVGIRRTARSAAVGAWERTSGPPSRAGSDVGAASADGVGLDGFLFVPSSAPAPAQTLSSSPVGLVYVGELNRNENLFDLGGGPHAFNPGRNDPRRAHSVPASDFDFGGDMGRSNGGSVSRGPRVSTKGAPHRGGGDGEDHSDSGGSSPLNCGLSSDTPLAPGDGHRERGDSCDGGESAMISGMFASV